MEFKFYLKYDDEIVAEGTDEAAIQEYLVSLLQEKREESYNFYMSRCSFINNPAYEQMPMLNMDNEMAHEKARYKLIKVPVFNKGE